jgi:lipoyl(octanoyl) transferase
MALKIKPVNWFQFDVPASYTEIESLQKTIFNNKLAKHSLSDVVIACQHFPVLTLGRRTKKEHLLQSKKLYLQQGIDIHDIVRGGSVTAHEPGQLVFYPILNLKSYELDSMQYVQKLTTWMLQICQTLGLECSDQPKTPINHPEGTYLTGVWAGDLKVASIGIRVQRQITMHGVAININNNCDLFKLISPCGMPSLKVSSLKQILGLPFDLMTVMQLAKNSFKEIFNVTTESIDDNPSPKQPISGYKYVQKETQ